MKITLSDADRERLGAPEEIDCDMRTYRVSEAIAVERATGMEYVDVLKAVEPVVTDIAGDPPRRRFALTPLGMKIRVWLGLHRAGVEVDFAALDFEYQDLTAVVIREIEEPGKADSPSGKPRTRSTSAASGRHTRSKTSTPSTS